MWNNIEILRKNIESVSFLEYKDDSNAILKELGAVERKDESDDVKMMICNMCNFLQTS